MKKAIAFKYCAKGCGADFYYGYSVQQTIGAIEIDDGLMQLPILLFDNVSELKQKSSLFDQVFVIYLFRSVYKPEVFSEVSEIKNFPKFVTIGAGAHPSGDPIGTLQYFDYVIKGDCEIALRDLLNCLINGQARELRGIWYKNNNEIIKGGRTSPFDLNTIPPFASRHNLLAPIEITRGCPWGCKFCCVSYIYGGKLRHRSIDEIIKWAEVAKEGGNKVINFLTPNAFSYGSDSSRDPRKIRKDKIEELLACLSEIRDVKIIFPM